MDLSMRKVFICSPYRGDIESNTKKAKETARIAVGRGCIPIVPHLYFPTFLDEFDEHERIEGIKMSVELMRTVDEIWVIGTVITAGMKFGLNAAKKSQIPVRLYDAEIREIDPGTLRLDRRITPEYRKAISGLKLI